jgi:DNA-binding XRE family transcriptional regulator
MSIYFNEKFKSLRKKYDLTQDQIADIFHVSPQSVSRWETGANYPDIEILPHIAGFFKVTVDELLGTELILSDKITSEYKRDIRNFLNAGKVCDAIDTARKAVKEFPVNYDLQSLLLQALCVSCSGELAETKESVVNIKNEIIAIGEKVINYCTDQNICLWVKFQLFNQYVKWNMKEEAKKILYTLPSEVWFTQDVNSGAVLDGEEWRQNQKLRIIRFTILLTDFIGAYAYKAGLDSMKKIECLKAVSQIKTLVSAINDNEGNLVTHIDSAFQNICIAELYCEAGDSENSLDYVEKATQDSMYHLDAMDQTDENGNNFYPWPTSRNLCWILWEDHLMKSQFDIIRNNERFIKCFELLKSNSKELSK